MNFFKLMKYLSLNTFYYNNTKIFEISKINEKENLKNLFINIKELQSSSKIDNLNLVKLLYFNKTFVHQLLYNNNSIFELNCNRKIENLSYYFYLSLLINDDINTINYSFSINLIKFIHEVNEKNINECDLYKKIMTSKIIIDLIENYKGLDEYYKNIDEIEKIEKYNIKIIEDNIDVFNDLDLILNKEYIMLNNIDEIYIKIIISLIKKNKL